jgi:hypothetical protein
MISAAEQGAALFESKLLISLGSLKISHAGNSTVQKTESVLLWRPQVTSINDLILVQRTVRWQSRDNRCSTGKTKATCIRIVKAKLKCLAKSTT